MDCISHYSSPLGPITLSADGDSLTGLWFVGQKYFGSTLSDRHEEKDLPVFRETFRWLDLYFEGHDPGFTPPLAPKGSPFRQQVWQVLLTIPRGSTLTYGQVGAQLGRKPGSAQAIGGAVGHNPISLIIPCHRVMGSDGSLTGYAGGVDKKRRLLELEGVDTSAFPLPK